MATSSVMDPVFAEVATVIFDGQLDPRELWDLSKLDSADVHINTPVKRKPKAPPPPGHSNTARALVLGGVAESLGTFRAGQKAHAAFKSPEVANAVSRAGKFKALASGSRGVAVGEFGLQAANLGIGLAAAHKLSQHAKEKQLAKAQPWRKLLRPAPAMDAAQHAELLNATKRAARNGNAMVVGGAALGALAVGHHLGRRAGLRRARADAEVAKGLRPVATAAGTPGGAPPLVAGVRSSNSGGLSRGLGRNGKPLGGVVAAPAKPPQMVQVKAPKPIMKSLTWTGEISKVDEDKRLVFGYCSVVEVDGKPVVDRQGDYIPLDEVEKSAYKYVVESRKGGDMHTRVRKGISTEWTEPKHTADLVESFVVTPEKLAKMGLTSSNGAMGWWVGFKVNDDDQWNLVKSGDRQAFSIHGVGSRADKVLE